MLRNCNARIGKCALARGKQRFSKDVLNYNGKLLSYVFAFKEPNNTLFDPKPQ